MEQEWSLKDVLSFAPVTVIVTSYAFAFNVGYFFAIDIGWFSLFSLSEHVVFALRALPTAIAASIGFIIGYNFGELEIRHPRLRILSWVAWVIWLVILLAIALWSLAQFRLGICVTLFLVFVGTFLHYMTQPPKTSFLNLVYWISTTLFVTFLFGYFSAHPFFLHNQIPSSISIKDKDLIANVIFAGEKGILIYLPADQSALSENCYETRPLHQRLIEAFTFKKFKEAFDKLFGPVSENDQNNAEKGTLGTLDFLNRDAIQKIRLLPANWTDCPKKSTEPKIYPDY
jgi:hypothetical protein